jgi:anhydro-N-acetylmuramic acid kinase
VICDFRVQDVANQGQGAPLVPIGDALLFKEFGACLNLGGFANISFEQKGQRLAFDICPVNIVLNKLAAPEPYDKGGASAERGSVDQNLLFVLSELPYYKKMWPKSLGREWVDEHIWPLFDSGNQLSREDKLATFSIHVVDQLQLVIRAIDADEVLVTGGGAYNNFIINHLRKRTNASIIVPENNLVDFKEAIVFALLGALRLRNEINVLASVTGGCSAISSGVIYR